MKSVYILEYSFLDSINRCRGNSVYGVYQSLQDVEQAKREVIESNTQYSVVFSLHSEPQLFVA